MADLHLDITGLVAGYKPDLPILHGARAQVRRGEVVTLIGPNGAGKSTLIKAVAGLLRIEAGEVRLNGRDITGLRPDRLAAHGLAYVPQTANVFTTLTVEQNLILAATRVDGDRRAAVEAMYALFPDLRPRARVRAGGLSGGQRQMLAIGMAMIAAPELVMMDEPTAGLSPKAAQEVLALIRRISEGGTSVLLVEQNARAALAMTDRGYVLAEGRTRHEGTGAALLGDPRVAEIYLGQRAAVSDA